MSTILITGGTGLLGTALADKLLSAGDEVIILSRAGQKPGKVGLEYALWDIESQTIDKEALMRADYIVHLAGAGIAEKRWTSKRKKEIQNSRLQSSQLLASSLFGLKHKVKAVVSASALGWYGADKGGEPFKETDPPAKDFLGETCRLWEESVDGIEKAGLRVVKLRTGIVLSGKGGAIKEFLKPMKFGIVPIMGNGKQIMSWIHIDDLVDLYIYVLKNEGMTGCYNAVSPDPVPNKKLIKTIARARKRHLQPVRIPAFLLRMIVGEMSLEILKSCTVSSKKTQEAGFVFRYPTVDLAAKMLFFS